MSMDDTSDEERRFYVYEHWCPDQDVCFWVGKGTGDRSRRFKRNAAYDAIVDHLASLGICPEVRLVAGGLTNIEAMRLECDRAALEQHRRRIENV